MLQKTDVSNLITGLRPIVKRSVTFLAHHHSREIKKLENRKGNVTEKMKKKAETLRLESLLLNKVHLDDVIKYTLMLDFSHRQKLLDDMQLPLETKVMIKVATHKLVVSHLQNFRSKHNDWQEKLPDLLKTLGTRAQFKKKVQKQQEKSKRKLARKQQLDESGKAESSVLASEPEIEREKKVTGVKPKKDAVNKLTVLKEASNDSEEESDEDECNEVYRKTTQLQQINSKEAESDEVDSDDDGTDLGDSDDVESDDAESDDAGSNIGDSDDSKGENEDPADGKDNCEEETTAVKFKKQDSTKLFGKKKKIHSSSGSAFAEVRRFADLQKEDISERKLNTISTRLPSPGPIENEPVEEDTFFMTGGNKFLKTVSVKRQDGEGLPSSFDKSENDSFGKKGLWAAAERNLPGNRRERRAQLMGRELKTKPKRMNSAKEFDGSQHPFHKKDRDFTNSGSNKTFKNQFDSSERRKSNDFPDKRRNGREFSGTNKKNMKDDSKFSKQNISKKYTDESLHPSWEAKKRLKVAIDSFQGKKIKFDDHDFGSKNTTVPAQSKPDDGLHPSWEAKKRQKVALDSFQGKKIKFDDD